MPASDTKDSVPEKKRDLEAVADEKIDIYQGHIDQSNLVYETHDRGRNWVAVVSFDPGAPSELSREFWDRNGKNAEVPRDLVGGALLEVAADYYTGSGTRKPRRRYYRVLEVGESLLLKEITKPTKSTPSPHGWRVQHGKEQEDLYRIFEFDSDEKYTDAEGEIIGKRRLEEMYPGVEKLFEETAGDRVVTIEERNEDRCVRIEPDPVR